MKQCAKYFRNMSNTNRTRANLPLTSLILAAKEKHVHMYYMIFHDYVFLNFNVQQISNVAEK